MGLEAEIARRLVEQQALTAEETSVPVPPPKVPLLAGM